MYRNEGWRKVQAVIFIVIVINIFNISKAQKAQTIEKCGSVQEEKEEHHDLTVIFYYVSWAQDNHAKLQIYEEIAEDYGSYVHFMSKDCYQLNCNCSRIYANPIGNPLTMNRWPILEVFHANDYMLRYTGHWNYAHLAHFMEALLQPTTRINNQPQLQALTSQHDAIILAYFPNINNFKLSYIQFMASAYQFLEYDAQQAFKFAISIGQQTALNLFGQTLDWPQIFLLTTHNHSKALDNFPAAGEQQTASWKQSKLLQWLQLIWVKLHNKLQGYSSPTKLAVNLRTQPVLALIMQPSFLQDFKLFTKLDKTSSLTQAQCFGKVEQLAHKCAKLSYWHIFYNNNLAEQNYFEFLNERHASLSLDIFMQRNARLLRLREKCQLQPQYMPTQTLIALTRFIQTQVNDLLLANNSNLTMTVILLDAQAHADFLHKQQIYTAFIAHNQEESIYKLEKACTFENVILFVQDYLAGNLRLHRLESQLLTTQQGQQQFVQKVNSSLLLHKLQNDGQKSSIVLLQFAKNCVFCNLMLQALQQISAILSSDSSNLTFLSINMHTNSLPWELNVQNTPTLLVFPKGKFSESRIFPTNLRLNVRNIFAFIVAQLEPLEQLQVSLQMCQHKMPHLRTQNCLQFVQQLVIQHIGKHLKYWQLYDDDVERTFLLKQLNEFRNINLDLQRTFSH